MVDFEELKISRDITYPYNIVEALTGTLKPDYPTVAFTGQSVLQLMSDALSERERQIVEMRWRDKRTYDDIGRVFNVTRERVRQVEHKAFRKMFYPSQALRYAVVSNAEYAKLKREKEDIELHFHWFLQHGDYTVKMPPEVNDSLAAFKYEPKDPDTHVPIANMDLSVRAYNCLQRAGYHTLYDILQIPDERTLRVIRNLGARSMQEIVDKVHSYNLKFKWELPMPFSGKEG